MQCDRNYSSDCVGERTLRCGGASWFERCGKRPQVSSGCVAFCEKVRFSVFCHENSLFSPKKQEVLVLSRRRKSRSTRAEVTAPTEQQSSAASRLSVRKIAFSVFACVVMRQPTSRFFEGTRHQCESAELRVPTLVVSEEE